MGSLGFCASAPHCEGEAVQTIAPHCNSLSLKGIEGFRIRRSSSFFTGAFRHNAKTGEPENTLL